MPLANAIPAATHVDRTLFRRADAGHKTPAGVLVKILQSALKSAGHYTARVDGSFGPATELAVIAFQRANGLVADGCCRNSDWESITGLPAPSLFDRCLALTADFEGTGFERVVGNFDGAFITWGITGYTLRHDMPVFLIHADREYPGTLANAFGALAAELRKVLVATAAEKERWANSISTGANKYGVRDDWRDAFARLGAIPEIQKLQIDDVLDRWWGKICLRDAKRWGAADAIDIAMMFDMAVQNGGGGRETIAKPMDALARSEPGLSGLARRRKWALIMSEGSNAVARADVLSRRSTIATGEGKVHGSEYVLGDWGLEPFEIDLDELAKADATFMPASFAAPAVSMPRPAADATVIRPVEAPIVISSPAAEPPAVVLPPVAVTGGQPPVVAFEAAIPADQIDLTRDYRLVVAVALAGIKRENIDRNWGTAPPIAVGDILKFRAAALPQGWEAWEEERKAIALIQLVAKLHSIDPGSVDGRWGAFTQYGFESLCYLRDHGKLPPNFKDEEPIDVNPHGFPTQNQAQLNAFYGPVCKVRMVKVKCPWPLRFAWQPFEAVPGNQISIHEKLVPSLTRILETVHQHYGEAELKRLRLDLFGGSYNCRKMRGGSNWSMHSWAIAIDWDPDRNQLKWGRDRASLARPEYQFWWETWEKEGWLSLGRVKNMDWMHVQAAKLK